MPTSKEELALRWATKSEEEKNIVRKKTAERVKKSSLCPKKVEIHRNIAA